MEVRKIEKILYSILEPYDNWFNDEGKEKNQEAKKALADFCRELLKRRPEKTYKKRNMLHMSYIINLVNMKRAFMQRKYMRVCNELISLMHYKPFFQPRIYYNVLKLLEEEVK